MKFICVLSVYGSLASYIVEPKNGGEYQASLKGADDKRKDIPHQVQLNFRDNRWEVEPWHEEVAPSLIHAIEAGFSPL